METSAEVNRLRQVYRDYNLRGYARSKWDEHNPGNQAIHAECQSTLQQLLQNMGLLPLKDRRILDLGCGTGDRLAALTDWGAVRDHLVGVDLIPERIETAKARYPQLCFRLANAEVLPFPDQAFDLVIVFTVFTSILDHQMKENVSGEINRVLAQRGSVIWYDFRMHNPLNRNVGGVSRRQIQDLFCGFKLNLQSVTLLPPLARRLGILTQHLYPILNTLPFLRSHYLAVLTKP